MRVLNAAQMREADRQTIEDIGIPSIVLMEVAGRQVVAAMAAAFHELDESRVVVMCGRGNNGGDGFVVARVLLQRGVNVEAYLLGAIDDVRGDARTNLDILSRLGATITQIHSLGDWDEVAPDALDADVIVDALFGTGLSKPLDGVAEAIVDDLNAADVPVVSIDLPSGLSADQADPIGPHVVATLTVTLGATKYPLVLPPAEAECGSVVVADIGIPGPVIAELEGPFVETVERTAVAELLPARASDSHKGTFGHVLVVAGSRGKSGAAHLAAVGALRCGAGRVTVATPACCQPVVASLGAEYMSIALDEEPSGTLAAASLEQVLQSPADVIAVGPGIGVGPGAHALVEGLIERAACPLVLDADALNVLAGYPSRIGKPGRPVIVTPHPGEMARLCGTTTADVQRDRLGAARTLAERFGVYVILKGYRTVIASPDGHIAINGTGNPGMATGGSGDVLTGMVAAWLAQSGDPMMAAKLAVHLHGAAGDLAASRGTQVSLTAGDLAKHIGAAIKRLLATDHEEAEHHDCSCAEHEG
jgi:ADP-dependent NAD(P)H-hydrate dehydratase / NAD(P)H-hydrate epimerase